MNTSTSPAITLADDAPCACTSGKTFAACCAPYLRGTTPAPTAEALMRSRYSAYVLNQIDYIAATDHPSRRGEFNREAAVAWATKSQWQGLEVVASEAGGADDQTGMVEFIARFHLNGADHAHRERSEFSRVEGRWHYVDGQTPTQKPFVKSEPAPGRNDPCHCGSGKKFKKCHGA
jgi:SEC-C motif-containing protein